MLRFHPTSRDVWGRKRGVGGAGSTPHYRQQKIPVSPALGQKKDPGAFTSNEQGRDLKGRLQRRSATDFSRLRRRPTPSDVERPPPGLRQNCSSRPRFQAQDPDCGCGPEMAATVTLEPAAAAAGTSPLRITPCADWRRGSRSRCARLRDEKNARSSGPTRYCADAAGCWTWSARPRGRQLRGARAHGALLGSGAEKPLAISEAGCADALRRGAGSARRSRTRGRAASGPDGASAASWRRGCGASRCARAGCVSLFLPPGEPGVLGPGERVL